MPDMGMYSYRPMTAPKISYAGAYGNYQHDMSAYMQGGYNGGGSGILGMSEAQIYNLAYNAVSAAINNSKLMNDQKDMVEGILRKPTMEIGDLHDRLVKDSYYKGGNMCGGSMQRFVIADELY